MIPKSTKRFYAVVAIVFCIFVLIAFIGIKFASKSLRPIFFGIVIAYLFKPMCNVFYTRLNKLLSKKLSPVTSKKWAHALSIIFTYIVWFAIIYILLAAVIPTVIDSIISFGTSIPSIISYFVNLANQIATENEFFGELFGEALKELNDNLNNLYDLVMKNWSEIYKYLHPLATGVVDIIVESFTFIFNIFVGLIVSVYLLAGRKKLGAQAKLLSRSVFGKKWAGIILEETRFADRMFSGYFVGSLIDSAIVGIVCYLACLVMKTPYTILVSMIICITNLIPFFGPWIGLFCSGVIILTQSPLHALTFVIFVWVLQQIDGNILAPRIQGSKTGLSSFWVLFAILLFGGLFGFVGMIIGVPVFAVIYDICGKLMRYCLHRRGESEAIEIYEKEFMEEEKSQSQGFQLKLKRILDKDKKTSTDASKEAEAKETPTKPKAEAAEASAPKPEHHEDEESERERARFKSFTRK